MEPNRAQLVQRIRELSSPRKPIATEQTARLTSISQVRAVAFDIYGTLVTSGSGDVGTIPAADGEAAFAQALRAMDIEAPDDIGVRGAASMRRHIEEAHIARRLDGVECPEVDIREIWREVFHDLGLKINDNLTGGKTAEFERFAVEYECRANPVWPMPGARGVIDACRDKGLMLGIVSNAQFFTPLLFEALLGASLPGLGFPADHCIYSYEILEAKPSERLYETLMLRLWQGCRIEPDKVLYLGNDIRNDVWPAQKVGMRTALFAGDERSLRLRRDEPQCRNVEPDAVLTELSQLPELLP